MHVLQVTATYTPSINGVAIIVNKLKDELEKLDIDVTVLAPNISASQIREAEVIRYGSLPNPFNRDYPIPLYPSLRTIIKLLRGKKPDIVHTHHPLYIGYLAKLIARYFQVPLVFTYHTRYGAQANKYLSYLPSPFTKDAVEYRVDRFLQSTDLVVSPSQTIADSLISRMPYLTIVHIPTGISQIPRSTLSPDQIRSKLSIPVGKKVLLTVCRITMEKNLPLLIQSMRYLPDDYMLLLVGGGLLAQRLKQIADTEGVSEKVIFVGMVQHDELGVYYQAADIFVFPSLIETQGIVLLEALSFGLPIVAVESDASKEWVSSDVGCLTQNDPVDLSRGIQMILQKGRSLMYPKATEIAENNSFSQSTQRILEEYHKIIKRKSFGKRLDDTGWQSWSPRPHSILRIPAWNDCPKSDTYLPDTTINVNPKLPATGWCSWYAFGSHITETKILAQSRWFASRPDIPIDYILIDAGWTKHGDWMSADMTKFPNGIHTMSTRIRETGKKPGIWVAPFWVEPNSDLFQRHNDWIVKGNILYTDGHQCAPFLRFMYPRYVLDIRKTEVMQYIFECLDYLLISCGFDLVKMDYLYSIYFIPNISSNEAGWLLRKFFMEIRRRYPKVYTIACGSPLKPAVGVVDSMRIGPDVISPGISKVPFINKIINTYKINLVLHNAKTRGWTREYWNLDLDAFVCDPNLGISDIKHIDLRNAILQSRGNIFLGDDMTALSEQRIRDMILPLFQRS